MVTCHLDRIRKLGSLNGHKEGHLCNHLGGRRYEHEMRISLSSVSQKWKWFEKSAHTTKAAVPSEGEISMESLSYYI